MKAVEFEGTVTPNGQIAIPAEIAEQLPPGEPLHIVLQWDAQGDEDDILESSEPAAVRSRLCTRG